MPPYAQFIGDSEPAQRPSADRARTVNYYVEQGGEGPQLVPTPGYRLWAAVPEVNTRGATVADGRLFAVIGGQLYEFDNNGVATARGAVALDGRPAQLVFNGVVGGHLLIASGGNAYCFVLATNSFTQVLTGDALQIAYCEGRFLAFSGTTRRVRESNLNDGTVWPADIFFQRSLFADPWQAMFVDGQSLIWLPGTESFEVWHNTGEGTQPFAPLSGLVGRVGIAAPFAWGLTPTPTWLASTPDGIGSIVRVSGSQAPRVSPDAVETAIARYARATGIADAEALVHAHDGHTFFVLSFPAAVATWAPDLDAQSWCERGQWNVTRGAYDLWAPRTHVSAFGKSLVGDRTTGTIWALDPTLGTEVDGTGIRRLRRAPFPIDEHRRRPAHVLELLMDVGQGLAAGQGSDPQAMLRCSSDRGQTWGNERTASYGRLGEYRKRVYWTRLGVTTDAVEVTISDPVPARLSAAWINNLERVA